MNEVYYQTVLCALAWMHLKVTRLASVWQHMKHESTLLS